MSQPALGLQIRLLEESLGSRLIERHSRGVSPTADGRFLYQRAQEILRLIDETADEIRSGVGAPKETISLGLTNGLIRIISGELVRQVRASLPKVRLRLFEEMSGALADAVEGGEIDLAFAYEIGERPDVLRIPLLQEELVFITAGHRGIEDDPMPFAEVLNRPLVVPDRRDGTFQLFRSMAARLARKPDVALEMTSVAATIEMVAHGEAESIMPYATVIDHLERGMLTGRRIANPPITRTLYLVRLAHRSPFAQEPALLDLLGEQILAFARRLHPLSSPIGSWDAPLSAQLACALPQAAASGNASG